MSLNTVEISGQKAKLSQFGKKTEKIDSLLKQQFKFSSVGEALSFNSGVFVKSYGPGGIATTALRGGNASQTAVLWNGFNIQNAMLGQSDLTLMPSVLFENMEVEYGGSASLWGSGAVGGSIHLDTRTPFNAGFITTTNLGGGSFGMLNGSTRILVSKQRFASSTKLYGMRSDNNFSYKDPEDKEQPNQKQKNAAYNFKGLMQELKFRIGTKQLLSLNAWANSNNRRLPGSSPSALSKTYQQDAALRLTANWDHLLSRFRSSVKLGYFYDRIDYTDSIAALFSKSHVHTLIAENENYLDWHKANRFNFGVNVSSSTGVTGNYAGTRSISRISLLAGNRFSFFENRFAVYAAARAEYLSVGTLPVTGNLSAEWQVSKRIAAKLNGARVYRQPTLNELYWVPGGNPSLKPEQGYTLEGELNYTQRVRNVSFFISGAAYSRKIANWILWIPGGNANPTPINIQQVWSRGMETTWRVRYQKNNWRLGLSLITSYVLSTIQSNRQENNNTQGRQLIYTPRYIANGTASFGYRAFNLIYFYQYTGYRFTSSDNSQWLDPYHLSSLKLNYNIPFKSLSVVLFLAGNNLSGSNYQIVGGRPMPLQNYEFGITLQTKK